MTRYTLSGLDGRKRVEATATPDSVRLVLRYENQAEAYFDGSMERLLTYSEGRPWRFDVTQFRREDIVLNNGELRIAGMLGPLHVLVSFSFGRHDLLYVKVVWTNRTDRALSDAAVGVALELPARAAENATIPHMIYNNNPSADPERVVPRLGVGPGNGFICEEHRLPIPCVNVEWPGRAAAHYLTLFAVPSYVETEDGKVNYFSLGAVRDGGATTIASLSGVLMFNGEKDVVYVGKSKTQPYDGGYVDVPPGFSLSKEYALDWGTAERTGLGFRKAVEKGIALFDPQGAKPLTVHDMIRLKTNAMDDRWREAEGAAGYVKFNDSNAFGSASRHPPHFLYGWTGQCLKLAWCDGLIGFEGGGDVRIDRCRRAVDFYVRESKSMTPGLRRSTYRLNDGQWENFRSKGQPAVSSRAYGETVSDLADIAMLFKEREGAAPGAWVDAVRDAADFFDGAVLPSGIYPAAWLEDGTPADDMITAAGIPCAIAMLKAFRLTGESRYLARAEQTLLRYYELHAATFERPFARSTLDAKCEDKEAGMYFFLAAYELFDLTKEEQYKAWAEIAADWLLTYVYVWNPVCDRGSRLREAGFNAVGWPGVSVQNHHLDVFFPTYELWRFGRLTGNPTYERMGRLSFDAMGQGICREPGEWGFTVVGEQGEGFYPTHYHQRGGSNTWNPSWIIALVLSNALKFRGDEAAKEGAAK
ncbi:hypothetical protein [Paenibacillus sp.]|uniref:hypothetical protein n=1 Tax=Paenibacillus sp. TaxID=58172 RepID=UPI002D3613AC|nr:hypothetical protein [Paenibacillus sp.]HZG85862.1 hypothetical protein [Paenibacillus sp.]